MMERRKDLPIRVNYRAAWVLWRACTAGLVYKVARPLCALWGKDLGRGRGGLDDGGKAGRG